MSSLFDLKEEIEIKHTDQERKTQQLALLKSQLGPQAIDFKRELISTGRDPQKIDIYASIVELESDLKLIDKELDILSKDLAKKYEIFQRYNDEKQKIYTEKELYKYSNINISIRHGLSVSQINRIVKKINKNK